MDATQTPPDLSTSQESGYTRVDFYLEQMIEYDRFADLGVLLGRNGFYAKHKVIDAVTGLGGDLITRLDR